MSAFNPKQTFVRPHWNRTRNASRLAQVTTDRMRFPSLWIVISVPSEGGVAVCSMAPSPDKARIIARISSPGAVTSTERSTRVHLMRLLAHAGAYLNMVVSPLKDGGGNTPRIAWMLDNEVVTIFDG